MGIDNFPHRLRACETVLNQFGIPRRARPRRRLARGLVALAIAATAAASAAPVALPATSHPFTATYTGHGRGQVHGTSASGSATLPGRGKPIGPSTLSGSARGVFINRMCVVFSGAGVLKSKAGSISLTTHGAEACAGRDSIRVSFGGRAKVAGGTGIFKTAHGTLMFSGTFIRTSGSVSISFKGPISY